MSTQRPIDDKVISSGVQDHTVRNDDTVISSGAATTPSPQIIASSLTKEVVLNQYSGKFYTISRSTSKQL